MLAIESVSLPDFCSLPFVHGNIVLRFFSLRFKLSLSSLEFKLFTGAADDDADDAAVFDAFVFVLLDEDLFVV
jgi:hypothetical protein